MSDNTNTPDDGGLGHILTRRYSAEYELRALGEADDDGRVSDAAVTRRLQLVGDCDDAVGTMHRLAEGHFRRRAETALHIHPDDTPPAA
ncbi:hypothetical protein PV379_04665 [Streptomyces caniscabiei]|uniref:hypothetical protein n=1 Tax=Streptomyces caniscabiei TaxID=2746961 RepID=UPI0029A73D70|nr:hypothetical protein [Streptomyces caniscabiei]MDX2776625.1 hypothetical protein [Streptomyces caniscabiei]